PPAIPYPLSRPTRRSSDLAAVAAGSSAFAACGGKAASTEGCPTEKGSCPNSKAELKISFQEGIAPGANLNEKLDYMEKLGVVGLDRKSTRLNSSHVSISYA